MNPSIWRIRTDEDDVGIGSLDGAHHGGEVGYGRRVEPIVDNLQSGGLCVGTRAIGGVLAELGVGAKDGYGLRFRVLFHRNLEEAAREFMDRILAIRNYEK